MAFVVGLGLIGTFSAFKAEKRVVAWYFIGTNLSDATDASFYTQTPTPSQIATCGNPSPTLPCRLNTPNSVMTEADLDIYFQDSAHDTPAEIFAQAATKKP